MLKTKVAKYLILHCSNSPDSFEFPEYLWSEVNETLPLGKTIANICLMLKYIRLKIKLDACLDKLEERLQIVWFFSPEAFENVEYNPNQYF